MIDHSQKQLMDNNLRSLCRSWLNTFEDQTKAVYRHKVSKTTAVGPSATMLTPPIILKTMMLWLEKPHNLAGTPFVDTINGEHPANDQQDLDPSFYWRWPIPLYSHVWNALAQFLDGWSFCRVPRQSPSVESVGCQRCLGLRPTTWHCLWSSLSSDLQWRTHLRKEQLRSAWNQMTTGDDTKRNNVNLRSAKGTGNPAKLRDCVAVNVSRKGIPIRWHLLKQMTLAPLGSTATPLVILWFGAPLVLEASITMVQILNASVRPTKPTHGLQDAIEVLLVKNLSLIDS